ncbi:MAG: adenylate kinase [Gemmataceae bacterium]|nr:adenylate kinase [Gemmataceae bacterium]
MRLILVGPPGSGKGTQAKLLGKRLGAAHISTGDILRKAKEAGTPAGKRAAPFLASGQLAPDDLVNEVVAELFHRDDRPEHFVLDGYPRTVAQAASLEAVLRQQFMNIESVIILLVHDEEIVERLRDRRTCPVCSSPYHLKNKPPKVPGICDMDGATLVQRLDDKEETVRQRLKFYHELTEELIPFYQRQGLVREVRAEGDIEKVYKDIEQVLKHQAGPAC